MLLFVCVLRRKHQWRAIVVFYIFFKIILKGKRPLVLFLELFNMHVLMLSSFIIDLTACIAHF